MCKVYNAQVVGTIVDQLLIRAERFAQ